MKRIYIERQEEILRAVIKDNDEMREFLFEEESGRPIPGEIYKGVVKNIVPAINSVFIDIGVDKNVYMHLDKKSGSRKIKCGDEIVVEILKEEVGDKGAKVTGNFNIPGTYCVLNTNKGRINFSKRIDDRNFIKQLKENIIIPDEAGITIRTNAQNASVDAVKKEIEELYGVYKNIIREANYSIKPKKLYSDEGVLGRILRDTDYNKETTIIVNNKEDYNEVEAWFQNASNSNIKIELHDENRMMFDYYGIEKEILSLRKRVVELECGGHIVIDKTEAMYVVDVNSGGNINNKSIKETAKKTNIEAAVEIARQIRLRNLSGIIVIDFIDINSDSIREKIISVLKKGFIGDKNTTKIYPFTELNLVQIARRRRGNSIYDYTEEKIKNIYQSGNRIKLSYVNNLIRNEIVKIDNEQGSKDIYISLSGIYKRDIMSNIKGFVEDIKALNKKVYLNFIDTEDELKVEQLLFESDIKKMQSYKIYG